MILIMGFIKRQSFLVCKPIVAGYFIPQFLNIFFCGDVVISELLEMLSYVFYQFILAFCRIDEINNLSRVQNLVFRINLALFIFR